MTELDGHEILGRPVKIKPGVAKSGRQTNGGDQSRSPPGPGPWRRQENVSFAKMNSDSSRRVYVGGIPRLTEQEALQDEICKFFQGFTMYVMIPLYSGPFFSFLC